MDLRDHKKLRIKKEVKCPECKSQLRILMFMGTVRDGFVCPSCKAVLNEKREVIGRSF